MSEVAMAVMTHDTPGTTHRGLLMTAPAVIVLWAAAAFLVLAVDRALNPASVAAEVLRIGAILLAAFAYMSMAGEATVDHAVAVGATWLVLSIVAEMTVSATAGVRWLELIGSPDRAFLRSLQLIAWIGAPALFARNRSRKGE
jgi:hypothetical protein